MSWRIGLRSWPSNGAGIIRLNGFDVIRMNSRNAAVTQPCTDSTVALSVCGRRPPKIATRAENSTRISTHRSIEPSWLPQHAADLEDHRLRRVGILEDVHQREVGAHIGDRQRREGQGHEPEGRERHRLADGHQPSVAGLGAPDRQHRLDDGEPERQHQRVVADFGDHHGRRSPSLAYWPAAPGSPAVSPSCQWPCAFSASATSFGM